MCERSKTDERFAEVPARPGRVLPGLRGVRAGLTPGRNWRADSLDRWISPARACLGRLRDSVRTRPIAACPRRANPSRRLVKPDVDPPEERHGSPVEPQRGALGATDLSLPQNNPFGANVFSTPVQRQRLPEGHVQEAPADARAGRGARPVARRCGRRRDEGLGARARRDALHARLPAADRLHRREARLVLQPDRRGHRAGRLLRQGADPGRAGCIVVPDRRYPRDLRGPRLHRVGSDQPGIPAREPERHAPLHPDGVRVMDG